MSNVITLDKLREEVEKTFAPCKVVLSDGTEVTLRSVIRLGAKDRQKVLDNLKVVQELGTNDDEDEFSTENFDKAVEAANTILLTAAANDGKKLVKELDNDFALILRVLNAWMEETQVGEAQPSPA